MRKGRKPEVYLSRAQVIRLSRLLNMKYRPAEIAAVLEVNVSRVYQTYIPAGCPHERDDKGHLWVVGTHFKSWAEDVIAKRKRSTPRLMAENEAWCFKCNTRVRIRKPVVIWRNLYIELVQSTCEECGTRVNRARKRSD